MGSVVPNSLSLVTVLQSPLSGKAMKLAILLAVLVVCGRCDDGGSTRIQRSALGSSGFSIPKAILSLALDVGRCRSAFSSDCSSNTVYSPLSIASTLTMLLMGTSGKSYSQLRTALKYPSGTSDSDINNAFKFLMQRMKTVDAEAGPGILLTVVNGLFSQKDSGFHNDYIIKARDFYLSEIAEMDFLRSSSAATNAINRWVSNKTNGKISNILTNLQPETQLGRSFLARFDAQRAIQSVAIGDYCRPHYVPARRSRLHRQLVRRMQDDRHSVQGRGFGSVYHRSKRKERSGESQKTGEQTLSRRARRPFRSDGVQTRFHPAAQIPH